MKTRVLGTIFYTTHAYQYCMCKKRLDKKVGTPPSDAPSAAALTTAAAISAAAQKRKGGWLPLAIISLQIGSGAAL